ncbi:MAG: hypothetical protein WCA20_20985 [Candidatus Sulfotelmatobacter sp.]
MRSISWRVLGSQILVWLCGAAAAFRDSTKALSPTNIFAPASTPAKSIFGLSLFVLAVTAQQINPGVAKRPKPEAWLNLQLVARDLRL